MYVMMPDKLRGENAIVYSNIYDLISDTYEEMFLALSQYMQEKGLEWNPQLKIISDWEQVSLNNYIFKYIFRLNVVHGKMSIIYPCMVVSSTLVILA